MKKVIIAILLLSGTAFAGDIGAASEDSCDGSTMEMKQCLYAKIEVAEVKLKAKLKLKERQVNETFKNENADESDRKQVIAQLKVADKLLLNGIGALCSAEAAAETAIGTIRGLSLASCILDKIEMITNSISDSSELE